MTLIIEINLDNAVFNNPVYNEWSEGPYEDFSTGALTELTRILTDKGWLGQISRRIDILREGDIYPPCNKNNLPLRDLNENIVGYWKVNNE